MYQQQQQRGSYPLDNFYSNCPLPSPPHSDLLTSYKSHLTSSLSPPLGKSTKKKSSNVIPAQTVQSFPYSYIRNQFLTFALDQHGSRLIQHHLSYPTNSILSTITEDCIPHLMALSTDVFGNYIVQKILTLTSSLAEPIVSFLRENIVALCKDQYGCRVIQASFCHPQMLTLLAAELNEKGELKNMLTHVNGNHVVQKIVMLCGPNSHGLIEILQENIKTLCKDQYGCRVVQRMVEGGCSDGMEWDIEACMNHQYGNYIIQHLLSYGSPDSRDRIFAVMSRFGLINLCQRKYSSNIVEKLLLHGSEDQVNSLLNLLASRGAHGDYNCVKLVQDPYGNYVVRKATETHGGAEIQEILISNIEAFKGNAYAKRVLAKLESSI